MKAKPQNLVLTAVFFLSLAFFLVGTLCNLGATFSDSERRVLSAFPDPGKLSLQNWTFDEDMERYLADHLVQRDALTGLHSYLRLATGTQRLNDIFRTKEGDLVESPILVNSANLTGLGRNLSHLDELAGKEDLQIAMLVPPSAGFARRGSLPRYLGVLYQDDALLSGIREYSRLEEVDLTEALGEGKGDKFYRTDNHWNADGAYTAYAALMEHFGIEPAEETKLAYESYSGFLGSTRSRSALWLTPGETIRYPVLDFPYRVAIEQQPERNDLYFRDALQSYDSYAVFFNGNYGIVRLQNDAGGQGSLLVIKDSFANSVVPLLLPHYQKIVMIDPRFFRGTVHDVIEENGIDRIVCICSLKTLATDPTLRLLK